MSSHIIPIKAAFIMFFILSVFLIIPWLIYSYRKYGYLSFWSAIVAFSFIFYMLSALFLVILPLPGTRDTCAYQSSEIMYYQFVPFYFVSDILNGSSVIWSQPTTYSQIFKQAAFWPAAYNFLLLLPLGVYVRYFVRKRHYWKRAFLIGFSVSLFFEITQLTGIYGLYNCPYRTFNVDDLMLNSAGTLAGFIIAPVLLALFPSKASVLAKKEKIRKQNIVLPIPQLLAVFIDFLLIKVSWSVTVGFFISNTFIEITYKTIGLFVVLFIVPVLWKGKTVGSRLLRYQLINTSGSNPLWSSLLKRFFALYLPWVMYKCLKAITQTELEIESPFYVFHLWLGLASMLGLLILVIVLFIHALIVIMKKGQRPFYFDDVANLLPRNSKLSR